MKVLVGMDTCVLGLICNIKIIQLPNQRKCKNIAMGCGHGGAGAKRGYECGQGIDERGHDVDPLLLPMTTRSTRCCPEHMRRREMSPTSSKWLRPW